MVIAPGSEGYLGILPHHAPLLTALGPGEFRVKKGGIEEVLVVFGGFMDVRADKVVV
jgi:F-type H+-transporting ATPase subunit epsilon